MFMRGKIYIILCLCLCAAAVTGCGNREDSGFDKELAKYVEFRPVSGYYEGREYTVELPYLKEEGGGVIAKSENRNVELFAEKIRDSSRENGYFAEASCVLTNDTVVSIRLKGKYQTAYGKDSEVWATNYSVTDGASSSIATRDFPHSDNYEGWLQKHIIQTYEDTNEGEFRIYNFHVPYVYYLGEGRLTAAVVFTGLRDGGETWQEVLEVDITDGPEPYFTEGQMKNVDEMLLDPAWLPSVDFTGEQINDEYGIAVSYFDNQSNDFIYQLFALGQITPTFPGIFDSLKSEIAYEEGEIHGSDYLKTYTFKDNFDRSNFVLMTRYWGEKDWNKGLEQVCYVGVDFIDGAIAGTIRGPGFMSEEELLARYPHDLYLATGIKPAAHMALNMSKPSKVYTYKDPNDQSNRDLAFVVKNGLVVSIDTAASYEYSRYDSRLGDSKPVTQMNNQASALEVKTVTSYKGEFDVLDVFPDYPDAESWTGSERLITVDIKAPQVAETVPDSKRINKILSDFQSNAVRIREELKKGNIRALADGDLLGHLSLDYKVYNFNRAAALVVGSRGYIFHGGGGNAYLIIYYDCDTGNIMTAREYLAKCGVTEESVLGKWAAWKQSPSFPENLMVKSIYDVKFAVDNSGNVILYEELSD
ncbi:hypothetical protein MASR2M70_03090 [Bacillota bacterium]